MFYEITMKMMETAVRCELEHAQKQHGETFHSMHEAESVLREELEEVIEEMEKLGQCYEKLKQKLREDYQEGFVATLKLAETFAKNLTMESFQVQAVIQKALISFKENEDEETEDEDDEWL